MNRPCIYPNFDFEYELSGNQTAIPPRARHQLIAKWQHLMRLLPDHQAAEIVLSVDELKNQPLCSSITPWGVTESFMHLNRTMNIQSAFPEVHVVKEVNDKRFSHALEQKLCLALPGSCIVGTEDELQHALAQCDFPWILKHPLGVSGREAVRGNAHKIEENSLKWAKKQWTQGWQLIFEPKITIQHEYSLQFDVDATHAAHLVGASELLTDSVGTFRGHRVIPDFQCPQEILTGATKAAKEVASKGYFGPLGIDAMAGTLGPTQITRPITEINARMTFGRLALELAAFLPEDWCYIWWHPSARVLPDLEPHLRGLASPALTRPGMYHLPNFIPPQTRQQSVVIAAPTSEELECMPSSPKFEAVAKVRI